MWENNRLVLCFCVACGVVASYTLSVYLLIFVIILCVYLYIFHYKSFELCGLATTRNLTFSAPLWIKNITTSLMNSYHLSKPLEPEQNSRRDSPFATNLHISRRGSCRSSPFTCLDENVDYANRRNGMGVVSQSSTPQNSFSVNTREIRIRSNYELRSSSKIESFTTPRMSPSTRKTSFNNSEITNVRRVQTVAGPLLGSPGISKRKANDYGLYVDACSPGLASRVVQYREESASPSNSVWTHQPQYSSPGQFPMVHLSHSPSTLPVLSPLNSQKASRRSVRVKIAPPDPLGSRLFPLSSKNNSLVLTQTDQSTKSVIETLKEISRKRIHSQLEDNDDDAAKRQKRNGPSEIQASNCTGEGENISKRTREESPRQQELSPTLQPAKRIRNNEILSSLSSSRKLLQSGGIKRKTQNLDWSRCSTPVLGKQQKTTSNDSESSRVKSDISSRISLVANKLASTLNAPGEVLEKSSSKDSKIQQEKEKKNHSSSLLNSMSAKSTPETSSDSVLVSNKKSKKGLSSPIEDSPWQKDSPFVTVASPDDVIDDIAALEEKREQDRRSRLLSMMTVISGGEPPVKLGAIEISKSDTQIIQPSIPFASSLVSTTASVTNVSNNNNNNNGNSEKGPMVGIPGWNSKSNLEGSTVEKSSVPPIQGPEPSSTTSAFSPTQSLGSIIATNPLSNNLTFGFGTTPSSAAVTTSIFNTSAQLSSPTVSSQQVVSSSSESLSLNSSQQLPVPGSSEPSPVLGSSLVFGNKPTVSSEQPTPSNSETKTSVSVAATSATTGTTLFNFGTQQNNQGVFGIVTSPTSSTSPQTVTSTISSAVTPAPATSTSTTSMFQVQPQASELKKDNTTSTSIGFSIPVSSVAPNPVQPSLFSKSSIVPSDKSISNNILQGASTGVVFGAVTNTGSNSLVASTASTATPLSFSVASPVSAAAPSSPQVGLFSFGSSNQQISQTSQPINNISASFGQPATSISSTTQNQISVASADAPKVGGFKFDLAAGKPLFTPNATPTTTANIFGTPGAANNEQKPFTFGSSKPLENPFASSTPNTSTQQISAPTNLFGSAATKAADTGIVKENIFSFGSNSTAPIFPVPQSTSFPAQPASTTSSSTGFTFQSASSGFPVQTPQSPAGVGFSLAATTAPSSSVFSAPTTSSGPAGAAFSFGSSPAFAPAQQSNLFAFGSNTKTQPETQQGSLFSFGSPASSTAAAGAGVFGQPASVTPLQTQPAPGSAPSSAFQFGSAPSSQQVPGAFNFGAPNASQSVGGSFSMNAGGFSAAAPAMFSIGSGSTAPRARSSRSRRPK